MFAKKFSRFFAVLNRVNEHFYGALFMRQIYFPIWYIFNLSTSGSNYINATVTQIAWNLIPFIYFIYFQQYELASL
jgi:hypothetical protein